MQGLEIKNETTATNTADRDPNEAYGGSCQSAKVMADQLPPYKQRFIREYKELKERYEKLKAFNTKIEAARVTYGEENQLEMPRHDCPDDLLREQQRVMGEYLHILELRAVIENVDFGKEA